jgi:hypothetical protein
VGPIGELNVLTNVSVGGATGNQHLVFNGSDWTNQDPLIAGLNDVEVNGPTANQRLVFDGSNWANQDPLISDLNDVNVSNPTGNQHLVFNGSQWVNQDPVFGDLSDVSVAGATGNQHLVFDGNNWVNRDPLIGELADVNLTGLTGNQQLVFDGSQWINKSNFITSLTDVGASGATANQQLVFNGSQWVNTDNLLVALTDVNVSGATGNQHLVFDGSKWVNRDPLLVDLNDVNLTGLTGNQMLVFNGNEWVNSSATIDDLVDVGISGPVANQHLVFDGQKWTNKDSKIIELADVSFNAGATGLDGQVLAYNATLGVWENKSIDNIPGFFGGTDNQGNSSFVNQAGGASSNFGGRGLGTTYQASATFNNETRTFQRAELLPDGTMILQDEINQRVNTVANGGNNTENMTNIDVTETARGDTVRTNTGETTINGQISTTSQTSTIVRPDNSREVQAAYTLKQDAARGGKDQYFNARIFQNISTRQLRDGRMMETVTDTVAAEAVGTAADFSVICDTDVTTGEVLRKCIQTDFSDFSETSRNFVSNQPTQDQTGTVSVTETNRDGTRAVSEVASGSRSWSKGKYQASGQINQDESRGMKTQQGSIETGQEVARRQLRDGRMMETVTDSAQIMVQNVEGVLSVVCETDVTTGEVTRRCVQSDFSNFSETSRNFVSSQPTSSTMSSHGGTITNRDGSRQSSIFATSQTDYSDGTTVSQFNFFNNDQGGIPESQMSYNLSTTTGANARTGQRANQNMTQVKGTNDAPIANYMEEINGSNNSNEIQVMAPLNTDNAAISATNLNPGLQRVLSRSLRRSLNPSSRDKGNGYCRVDDVLNELHRKVLFMELPNIYANINELYVPTVRWVPGDISGSGTGLTWNASVGNGTVFERGVSATFGSGIVGGKNALDINPASQTDMSRYVYLNLGNTYSGSNDFTFAFVIQDIGYNSTANARFINIMDETPTVGAADGTLTDIALMYRNGSLDSVRAVYNASTSLNWNGVSASTFSGTPNVVVASYSSSNQKLKIWVNNSTDNLVTDATVNLDALTMRVIGFGRYNLSAIRATDLKVAEVMFWASALTDENVAMLSQSLLVEFGVRT